jgi:hypothetical protein
MTDLLDQLATSITNLDGRLRDLASGPPLRACYDVLIPDSTIVIPGFSPTRIPEVPRRHRDAQRHGVSHN